MFTQSAQARLRARREEVTLLQRHRSDPHPVRFADQHPPFRGR
jgi:hypothetical protein